MRHPMYGANILIFLGIPGIFCSVLGILATVFLMIPATIYRISKEEYYLKESLENEYADYTQKTKKLISFVW
ncbi:hypothetical protein KKH43_02915 [Patescibacteria group bacterium]|nr:hypothetical protein [Patescibacteria group bacterium]